MTETTVYTDVQTCMFSWKVDLRIQDYKKLSLFSPDVRLYEEDTEDRNFCVTIDMTNTIPSIEFENDDAELKNRKFKECTIYMMDQPVTTIRQIFNGFGKHFLYCGKSINECCFLFEIKMECKPDDVRPVVWMRGSTFVNPKIITNETLDTEKRTIIAPSLGSIILMQFLSTAHQPYNVLLYSGGNLDIIEPSDCRTPGYYTHSWYGDTADLTNFDINEIVGVITENEFAKMEYHEITTISIIIKAFQSIVAVKPNHVKYSECSSIEDPMPLSFLYAYFSDNKFCDFTVHVKDQTIRAHKVVLANGSTVWHDMLLADETLSSVSVDDFEHETIKELIGFTYTGIIQKEAATDQLFKAADKFGVIPLKGRCETFLLEAINLKTAIHLLVLAHQYNATKLFSAAVAFIGENRAEFRELEEMKLIFKTYPELGHTLFAEFF